AASAAGGRPGEYCAVGEDEGVVAVVRSEERRVGREGGDGIETRPSLQNLEAGEGQRAGTRRVGLRGVEVPGATGQNVQCVGRAAAGPNDVHGGEAGGGGARAAEAAGRGRCQRDGDIGRISCHVDRVAASAAGGRPGEYCAVGEDEGVVAVV